MSGVNDLASTLRADTAFQAKGDYRAASLVDEIARTAWHPVSEPPTEADGDDKGQVLHWWFETQGGVWVVTTTYWRCIKMDDEYDAGLGHKWARIRDVILLPSA